MLQGVEYPSLPPDASRDCLAKERALTAALHSLVESTAYEGEAAILVSQRSCSRCPAASVAVRQGGRTIVLGLKPDYYAALYRQGTVLGLVVEAACTSPEDALPRIAPRLLLYKAWLDNCLGAPSAAVYAPLVPGENPVLITVEDPLAAWRCIEKRLQEAVALTDLDEPPAPGTPRPPCGHCGYRTQCPYSREV
jgi:hypothetical protein